MIDASTPTASFLERLRSRYGDDSDPPKQLRSRSGAELWDTQSKVLQGTSKLWNTLDERAGLKKAFHVARATYRRSTAISAALDGVAAKLAGGEEAGEKDSQARLNWSMARKDTFRADWGRTMNLALNRIELQRTVNAACVLRDWSRIFHHEVAKGLYEMSEKTGRIDTFVSHSWRTPGWARALALAWFCVYKRLVIAAIAAPLIWALFAPLIGPVVYWHLPQGPDPADTLKYPIGIGPLIVPVAFGLAAYSVVVYARDIYLDRCCMCQYDSSLMQASIHQLGAYIARSNNFLILWDENYCSRLWVHAAPMPAGAHHTACAALS
jgi:hypothetical protein